MNPQNNRAMHLLLNELGWIDQKESLVYSFTNERTVHSSEMTNIEALELIKHLRRELYKKEKQEEEKKDPAQPMRNYIFSIFHRKNNVLTKTQKEASKQECLDWVKKHFKADLNTFSRQDLYKIKLAAENMYADGAKAVRRAL